mgnify:FL=1|jgi:hypothetical protein
METLAQLLEDLQSLLKLEDKIVLLERKVQYLESNTTHEIANLKGKQVAKSESDKYVS